MRLTLSGGGFRAALFHLGVVRYLKEQGLLSQVTSIYSVSGGSILAAHLVLHWHRYTATDDRLFQEAASELVAFTRTDLRGQIIRRCLLAWLTALLLVVVPPSLIVFLVPQKALAITIALVWIVAGVLLIRCCNSSWALITLLQRRYDTLYRRARLDDLDRPNVPKLHLLATNLTSGELASFSSAGLTFHAPDEPPTTFPHNQLPVALGVAASSAFPPLFSPVPITRSLLNVSVSDLPHPQFLADGGVFDNLGVRGARWIAGPEAASLIVSSAERRFEWQINERFGLLPARAVRSTDILMQRVSDLESDTKAWSDQAVYIKLKSDLDGDDYLPRVIQRVARNIRTDLDTFSALEVQLLFYLGYGAARQAYQQPSDRLASVVLNEHQVPIAAQPPCWLPVASTDRGLNQDPLAALPGSSRTGLRLFAPSDWASWLGVAVLLLNLCLIYPSLLLGRMWYQSVPQVPQGLAAQITKASSGQANAWISEQPWIFPELLSLKAHPERCRETTHVLVFTEEFTQRTNSRPTTAFAASLETRDPRVQIASARAILLVNNGQHRSVRPLDSQQDSERTMRFEVPPSAPEARLLILVLLCTPDSRGLLEQRGSQLITFQAGDRS